MTELQTIIEKFSLSENAIVYRALKNKTDLQALIDANQSVHTFSDTSGQYIVVQEVFSHPDYVKVE